MTITINEKGLDSPLLDQALQLIETSGWMGFSVTDLGQFSQVSLSEIYATFPAKESIIEALSARIDMEILNQFPPNDTLQSPKDKLFEILMLRFDAFSPYKRVIQSIWDASAIDPFTILSTVPKGLHSLKWVLDISGHDTTGISGALKVKMFAFFYLNVMSDWLKDNSEDLSKTMASLDKAISRIDLYMC